MDIVVGIVSGIVCGMGMGGGTILIPMLVLLLGFDQINAQSINLVAFLPTAIVALLIQLKSGLVRYKDIWFLSLAGIVSAVGGSFLLKIIEVGILKTLFGLFLVVLGVFQLINALKTHNRRVAKLYSFHKYKSYKEKEHQLNWLTHIHLEF